MRREHLTVKPLQLFGVPGIPKIDQGDVLSKIILQAVRESQLELLDGDIIVIAHSVISKAEGRVVHQDTVRVSEQAHAIAEANGFDPKHVELALQESRQVLRSEGVLVTETHSGLVCNFSGVDRSNAPVDCFLLLPEDPDASASRILDSLQAESGLNMAVIISDTQGRPWRIGSVNIAIGCAGIGAFKHNRGKKDLYGRIMQRSTICQIDEIAAAAEPLMGQADDAVPVVIVRGYEIEEDGKVGRDVQRTAAEDLFR
jgi:coenzyme F420-0:L-glutamate ligase/coenzyme F420-1:gamma-L-glutamate ligase